MSPNSYKEYSYKSMFIEEYNCTVGCVNRTCIKYTRIHYLHQIATVHYK